MGRLREPRLRSGDPVLSALRDGTSDALGCLAYGGRFSMLPEARRPTKLGWASWWVVWQGPQIWSDHNVVWAGMSGLSGSLCHYSSWLKQLSISNLILFTSSS